MRRRALAAALALSLNVAAHAQPLVLSIDDGPSLMSTPRLSPAQRHAALRQTLQRHGITAVLYVTLNFGADRPEGLALARAWGEAGQLLGNHTVTHADLHDEAVPPEQYLAEIAACDAALNTLPGWRRWFRATYLHEGHTEARREGLRRFLEARRYRLARVDLDSRDWQFAPRLAALLFDPTADGEALKSAFIGQLLERARAMPPAAPGAPARVLLLHDNLLTALWLDDIVRALQAQGFHFVHPEQAWAPAQGDPSSPQQASGG